MIPDRDFDNPDRSPLVTETFGLGYACSSCGMVVYFAIVQGLRREDDDKSSLTQRLPGRLTHDQVESAFDAMNTHKDNTGCCSDASWQLCEK